MSSRKHILKANILRISYERCLAHAQRRRGALSPVEFMRSCSSCSGWPSQASWQAFRLSLERRPHPCSRCRARAAAAVALCVSALISGVATVITCIARHKALSRLAGAAVKQMAAHDGRDVHVSAHPAAQTPIDSGVCESFERSSWSRTQQCPGALRRSARRRQGLATPATRVRRAAPLSSWRAGHERQSVSGSGSGSAGPSSTCFVWKPFLLRPSVWQ